jgi:hypothetical protein
MAFIVYEVDKLKARVFGLGDRVLWMRLLKVR